MIELPGRRPLVLRSVVLDYNGTLATDGKLLRGLGAKIAAIRKMLDVHVVTGDTFGTARAAMSGLAVHVEVLPALRQRAAKERYVAALGAATCCAIGNGNNDAAMLRRAALGVAVIGAEGCATAALRAADVVTRDITDALDLLTRRERLVATLRT